ncbi:hypothetical protein AVEN_94613-1 [Araneus ventricosus]|uniref:Uncharacterized protein n=1 Tax=Araneus ventricosus TaxID=182803 RepID=A0A4Y2P899_ARAVE|nr:hypothetical protein AVEN_94613-1 [Araneus ventricosus]
MRGQYSQATNTHMMKIECSVDYVRSDGMRNVPVTKVVSICMRLLLNFQGAYSYPPRRVITRVFKEKKINSKVVLNGAGKNSTLEIVGKMPKRKAIFLSRLGPSITVHNITTIL